MHFDAYCGRYGSTGERKNQMPRRVRVKDLVLATGLSRATVDRALNGRGAIRPDTERIVREAYEQLRNGADHQFPAIEHARLARNTVRGVDAVIRFGRGLTEQVFALRERRAYPLELFDMREKSEEQILQIVVDLCRDCERSLIVGVKNNEQLSAELASARKEGKRIVTLVSDLSPPARDAFVGIDNRKAGQTAALIIGHGFRGKPGKAGVVLGDYAFRCHEDREIGFRSYLRSAYPDVVLTDAAKGEDSVEKTREAILRLIGDHPDIDAIYNVGGGNDGLAQALRESGYAGRIFVITHETNAVTLPLVREGIIDFLIAQSPAKLVASAMRAALGVDINGPENDLIDFTIHTKFNIPALDDAPLD
jgi:LacI family transcriptional regulator